MNQCIITEEELCWLINTNSKEDIAIEIGVRSRPYNPQAEREKILDELDRIMREEEINNDRTGYESFVWVLHEVVPRLRQSKEE